MVFSRQRQVAKALKMKFVGGGPERDLIAFR
jgi:hypothetical protein